MRLSFSSFSVAHLLVLIPSSIQSLDCGKWYSTPCLADEDLRYDNDYTNNLVDQNAIWKNYEGYWIGVGRSYDANGEPLLPVQFNPLDLSGSFGLPYNRSHLFIFRNVSHDGSREYEHNYRVYPASPQWFCDLPVIPPAVNSLFDVKCGINGFATYGEETRVSTYEKDGSQVSVTNTLGFIPNAGAEPSAGTGTIIGEETIFRSFEGVNTGGTAVGSTTWTFTNSEKTIATELAASYNKSFNTSKLISFSVNEYRKVSEDEFVAELQQSWIDNKVQQFGRGGDGILPRQTECLHSNCFSEGAPCCVTEEQWCEKDPECSESPYQEPDATLKAGPVVAVTVAAFIVLLGALYCLYCKKLQSEKKKIRLTFAQQIAKGISIKGKEGKKVTEQDIESVFKNADSSGNGLIQRDELEAYVMSKDGDISISRSDLDVMFSALDTDNSGNINVVEFVALMAHCNFELEHEGMAANNGPMKYEGVEMSTDFSETGSHSVETGSVGTEKEEYYNDGQAALEA